VLEYALGSAAAAGQAESLLGDDQTASVAEVLAFADTKAEHLGEERDGGVEVLRLEQQVMYSDRPRFLYLAQPTLHFGRIGHDPEVMRPHLAGGVDPVRSHRRDGILDRDHVIVAHVGLANRGLHAGICGDARYEECVHTEHVEEGFQAGLVERAEAMFDDHHRRIVDQVLDFVDEVGIPGPRECRDAFALVRM
jgi:hypothetical protein